MRLLALALVLAVSAPALAQRNRRSCPQGQVFDARANKCKVQGHAPQRHSQAVPATPAPAVPPPEDPVPLRGPRVFVFDDMLLKGNTFKPVGVYLYDRKELKAKSMVREPESFREEISL